MVDPLYPQAFLPLQQSPVYAEALAHCGAQVRLVDLDCGKALAIKRGRMQVISRGPVWCESSTARSRRHALRSLARWPGLTIVTTEEKLSGFGLVPLMTPRHHAIWALGPDLRAGMVGKWRNRLTAAEDRGVRITSGGAQTLEWLLSADARQQSARAYRALPERFTRALPPSALRLWEWQHAGQLAAAMAVVLHGTSASYHLAHATDVARANGVHGVMLAHAASSLRAEGISWLDLGSVDTEAAPGLARFKLGTGARLSPLGATMLVLP